MIRFLTAGESHGPLLTGILEGMPAGLSLTQEQLNLDLARRQQGYGSGGRMQIERDEVRITGGVMAGKTTGGPISLIIENRDWKNWAEKDIPPMTTPRPGHADLTGTLKYGYDDLRIALERSSARETAVRVAVGAICKRLLGEFGIIIGGYVTEIGGVVADLPEPPDYPARFAAAEESDVRCPDPVASEGIREAIRQCKIDKDTLGGVIEVVALHLPPGLGSHVHYDRRLSGRLVGAVCSVQSIKGAEIGTAFANTRKPGTQVHDQILLGENGKLTRQTNRSGGLEGGMTTGEPLIVRAAMKPISTTLTPLASVNLATGEPEGTTYERSDFCATPRAVPVIEAMVAIVLADALLEKLGGDSLAEMRPRYDALKRGELSDFAMHNTTWRFGYV
ncbi:MAG: chorismate synthase [Chloroflexota bacterium]|nr:chorismate synthase [Chloroflexota bacterium]GIK66748.1 MAG: chorismate synthase [Chloroflexota bacterium]